MPITKSAKRALRISRRNRAYNLKIKNKLKKEIKNILSLIKSNKAKGKQISQVLSIIDRAAKTKVIHKNKAARLKSKIVKIASAKKIKLEKRERKAPAAKKKITKKKIAKKTVHKAKTKSIKSK